MLRRLLLNEPPWPFRLNSSCHSLSCSVLLTPPLSSRTFHHRVCLSPTQTKLRLNMGFKKADVLVTLFLTRGCLMNAGVSESGQGKAGELPSSTLRPTAEPRDGMWGQWCRDRHTARGADQGAQKRPGAQRSPGPDGGEVPSCARCQGLARHIRKTKLDPYLQPNTRKLLPDG